MRSVLSVVVVALLGCTGARPPALGPLVAPNQAALGGDSEKSPLAPALGVTDEGGLMLDAAATQGKVVLVDFWASWCGPCQHSTPFYRRLYERFRHKGLMIIGVSVDEEKDALTGYLRVHPLPFNIVWDKDQSLTSRFGVIQLPTAFLFDRRGRLRKTRYGFDPVELRAIEDEVRLLLDEPAPE